MKPLFQKIVIVILILVVPFFSIGIRDFRKISLFGAVSQWNVVNIEYNYKDYQGVGRDCYSSRSRSTSRWYTYFFQEEKTKIEYEFCANDFASLLYRIKKDTSYPIKIYDNAMIPWNFSAQIVFALWHVYFLFCFLFVFILPYTLNFSSKKNKEKVSWISLEEFMKRNKS